MASPYVPNTDQLTQNLLSLFMQKQQNSRQDQILQAKAKRDDDQKKLQVAGAQALELRGLPDIVSKRTGLARLAQDAIRTGGDPAAWERMMQIESEDELNLALRQMAVNASDAGKLINEQLKGRGEAQQKQVNVLRKDISDKSKTFRLIDEAEKRIQAVGNKATAASDISLIFNYMKINDPGSTVREGEFATAQNAAGVGGKIKNLYNQMLEGTRLNPEQRADFLARAGDLAEAQREATDIQIENVLQQADQDQIERERVFGKQRLNQFEKRQAARQPQFKEGQTATNPQTGQKVVYRNGEWTTP